MTTSRVAVAGKGGAGKTTLSATLARLVARSGRDVLVIDGDSNPNVAVAMGVAPVDAAQIRPLPTGLVSRKLTGPALNDSVDEVVARYGVRGPDEVAILHMAMPEHADEGCLCSSHATVAALLADVGSADGGRFTILDLEASPEHFSRGTTRHVDSLLLVLEPYYRSLETARRMAELARQLPIGHVGAVANKIRNEGDGEAISEFCSRHDIELDAVLPWSDRVLDADAAKVPVVDHDPDGPYVAAVGGLADRLLSR